MHTPGELQQIVEILTHSFEKNKAVNFAVKNGSANHAGREALMNYALWHARHSGEILLSKNKDAAALLIESARKKYTLGAMIEDLKLVFRCIGLFRIAKVMKRESEVKKFIPNTPHIYLWFIGTSPESQGKGAGGKLLQEILKMASAKNLPVYLVTSTARNFSFYERHGFQCVGTFTDQHFTSRIYAFHA